MTKVKYQKIFPCPNDGCDLQNGQEKKIKYIFERKLDWKSSLFSFASEHLA